MTPAQLADLLNRADITQARAADLARVEVRTIERYLSGQRAIPLPVSSLLCMSLIILGAPVRLLAPWVHADLVAPLEARS